MGLYRILIPVESAYDVVNSLGYIDTVHFIDSDPSNPLFSRPFFSYVKRCEDAYYRVEMIQKEMRKFDYDIINCSDY